MNTLSPELLELIIELQSLDSLNQFALAGGTNLSIRYNHRQSIDIDLFSNQMIGKDGLRAIEKEVRERYKEQVLFLNIDDPGAGEQYCFIKSIIKKGSLAVKVEVLQNLPLLNPVEVIDKTRLISIVDIGVMKLQSLSNRKAQKDVYDLDIITDDIPLSYLMEQLKVKEQKFQEEQHKCLFDLDENTSPIKDPLLLLAFDKINYQTLDRRPSHSSDILKIYTGSKSWVLARTHWKRKVSRYCAENKIAIPKTGPIN